MQIGWDADVAHEMHRDQDGILRVKLWGNFSQEEAVAFRADFHRMLESAGEEMDALLQVERFGKASAEARKIFGAMFRRPHSNTGKTALVGANQYVRIVLGFILQATGASETRLFDSEKEAVAWLRQGA